MISVVHCDQCGTAGGFDVHLSFTYELSLCMTCTHTDNREWTFNFCTLKCMFSWLDANKVEKKGIPCRHCYNIDVGGPTGFMSGFKQNGVCKTCNGAKAVKQRKP